METTEKRNLPTIAELRTGDSQLTLKNDQFNALMHEEPPKEWVKEHPYIKNWKYISIEKVEYLLKKIFKQYKIEILREGISFNGVYVVVRLNYLHPITNEWMYHDGIGACQLQTKAGTSPADLININNGAVSMAFPVAESYAIKDAAEKFGSLFGSNLNRKDVLKYKVDSPHKINDRKEYDRVTEAIKSAKTKEQLKELESEIKDETQLNIFQEKLEALK